MAGQLIKSSFQIVFEDDSHGIRICSHDMIAVELLWQQVLGHDFTVLESVDLHLGSGIEDAGRGSRT